MNDLKQDPQTSGDGNQSNSADPQKLAADLARQQIDRIYNDQPPNQPKVDTTKQQPTHSPYGQKHHDLDLSRYHTAWQNYYQEYYRRYYHHLNNKQQAQKDSGQQTGEDNARAEEIKKDIITQVQRGAKAFKRSHHFVPILSALAVGLVFLFIQFNSVLFAQVEAYVSPGALEGKSLNISDPIGYTAVGPEPRLIIPKINVDIPVNYDIATLNENDIQSALQTAAVHYKLPGADSLPGQFGNSIILGHSSNDVFAKGDFKFAFVLADHLQPGDVFYMHYGGTRYAYKVTEKKVIKPNELGTLQIGYDKPMATLVTCTPPGTSINRLLVFGEQISPDPTAATKPAESKPNEGNNTQAIPGNAPTLFEQIWQLFT